MSGPNTSKVSTSSSANDPPTLSSPPALTGGCRCGRVTYSSTTLPQSLIHCHCQTCRRLSGAAFLTFASFPTPSITWTSGTESLKKTQYSDIADRTHCSHCGSHISMQYVFRPQRIYITAGAIDERSCRAPLPKPDCHIFVAEGEKAGWYDLPDDRLPRYSGHDEEFQKKLDAYVAQHSPG